MNIAMITDILEALTIFCFGLSWPISIRKSIISRTAKGKSLFFEVFLLIGYACGIARKIIQVSAGSSGFIFFLSFFFYVLNFVEISIDVGLYFRNKKLDELADSQNAGEITPRSAEGSQYENYRVRWILLPCERLS